MFAIVDWARITEITNEHIGNSSQSKTLEFNTNDSYINNRTKHIGLTQEEYVQQLKRYETEINTELKKSHVVDQELLEEKLRVVSQRLQDTITYHKTYIVSLKKRITRLEELSVEFPDTLLDMVIEALRKGDSEEADCLLQHIEDESEQQIKKLSEITFSKKLDRLFQYIEDKGEQHKQIKKLEIEDEREQQIKKFAEITFQRGKIAIDVIEYTDALDCYEEAVYLQPKNALYLKETGILHCILGNYYDAFEYLERSVEAYTVTYGEDHPLTWHTLGIYRKAIDLYELVLENYFKNSK